MPIYEYRCRSCDREFEHLARTRTEKPPACPACGKSSAEKLLSAFSPMDAPVKGLPSCASGKCSSSACSSGKCPMS
jgi:putative FmdB family regulatory protein